MRCTYAFPSWLGQNFPGIDGSFLWPVALQTHSTVRYAVNSLVTSSLRIRDANSLAMLAAAMLSGVVYGARGAIGELVALMGRQLGRPLEVFLTGGDSAIFAPLCPPEWQVAAALTLEGLRLAYAESRA